MSDDNAGGTRDEDKQASSDNSQPAYTEGPSSSRSGAPADSPLKGKIDDSHGPITEPESFEIYYRTTQGESDYGVAKALGLSGGAVSRLLKGDARAGRKPRPPFSQRLDADPALKMRYQLWVKEKEQVFEGKSWTRQDFNSLPVIRRWRESIRLRGSPSMLGHISILRRICTGELVPGFVCSPDKFTLNLDLRQDSPVRRWVSMYLEKTKDKKVPQGYSVAIRDFLATCQNVNIPRNFGHLYGLSGAKDHYGKHNTKMLTNLQWLALLKLLLESGNLRLAAKAAVGCEGFPRSETLDKLNPSTFREVRREFEGVLCAWTVFEKFESKTAKHRQTPFTVEIHHPLAIEIVKRYQEVYKPRTMMFLPDSDDPSRPFPHHGDRSMKTLDREDNQALREIYTKLGIVDPYYFRYPTYTFRHTGAKRWVRKCGGNYSVVAKRGWLGDQVLKDCYAGNEDEDDYDAKTCYQCRPPKYPTVDEERFCGLKCAVLYYTLHREEILAEYLPMLEAGRERR